MPTHPVSSANIAAGLVNGSTSAITEGLECSVAATTGTLTATANFFPRAIISRHKIINPDFNPVILNPVAGSVANLYMSGQVNINGSGNMLFPTGTVAFPMLGQALTPSVNIYMRQ